MEAFIKPENILQLLLEAVTLSFNGSGSNATNLLSKELALQMDSNNCCITF